MNKVILVMNPQKVEMLEEMGFNSCGSRELDGKVVHQFVVTDKLHKALNDKSKFNKKDYVYDMKLMF